MKRLTAATAAAAAACAQRHEMRRQRREAAELYEALRREKNQQVEELNGSLRRLYALNHWMMTRGFHFEARGSRMMRGPLIDVGFNSWPDSIPLTESKRHGLQWEISREEHSRMQSNYELRTSFANCLAATLAIHVQIALLDCDGRTLEAEELRKRISQKPI